MATEHYSALINNTIELIIYSEGGMSKADIENMSADELPYYIYNFKKMYDDKVKAKQDLVKSIFEYVGKSLDTLFKLLSKLGGGKKNG